MGIGAKRLHPGAILEKSSQRVTEVPLQRPDQRNSTCLPAAARIDGLMSISVSQKGESLIVEIETFVGRRAQLGSMQQ